MSSLTNCSRSLNEFGKKKRHVVFQRASDMSKGISETVAKIQIPLYNYESERAKVIQELDDITQEFFSSLDKRLKECEINLHKFCEHFEIWFARRTKSIDSLDAIIMIADAKLEKVQTAKLVGSSVCAASGLAFLGGLVLTSGVSALLTGGGIVFTSLGFVTKTVADFTGLRFKRKALKEACECIEKDAEDTSTLSSILCDIEKQGKEAEQFLSCSDIFKRISERCYFLTNVEIRKSLANIQNKRASMSDYTLVIKFWGSENFPRLEYLKNLDLNRIIESVELVTRVGIGAGIAALCVTSTSFSSSKTSTKFAAGAVIGLNVAVNMCEIIQILNSIHDKKPDEFVVKLQSIITKLKQQQKTVQDYYDECKISGRRSSGAIAPTF